MSIACNPLPVHDLDGSPVLAFRQDLASRAGESSCAGRRRLRAESVDMSFIEHIPRDFARQHLILAQEQIENDLGQPCLLLAVSSTTSEAAIFNVGVRLGVQVRSFAADAEDLARLIDETFSQHHPGASEIADGVEITSAGAPDQIEELLVQADRDLLSTQGKGPIIQLIDALLFEALGRSASDIHVQPLADRTIVRYRLDGVLHSVRELPKSLTNSVTSRIKVMGRMDIAERRTPQDGRASVNIGDRSIDLRISTLPTSYGERSVIRLLDNANHLCDFGQLGMPSQIAGPYLERATRANGMILLTGPTGSGKTTTLYSTLRRIGSDALNIMTIEDPIEYELGTVGLAISQSQVNHKKGISFATGLRHILRQDPDVIMVGEIRDAETGRIAIQSSLTGHLVLSTLHTNDSASAITRLIDLEVEPYLVSASLSAVLAQRLVRVFHSDCKGKGCDDCYQTGFRGRTGLFELLTVEQAIRDMIGARAPLSEIREAARSAGMRTLKEDAHRLVEAGLTSAMEVQRVVQGAI